MTAAARLELESPHSAPRRALRVLHVYSGNLFGGIERTFLVYAKYPRPDLWDVEYALCFEGPLRRELERYGATLHDLRPVRARDPRTVLRARKKLGDLLRSRHYDVLITHSVWGHALAAPVAKAHGINVVFHLHDAANGKHWLERLAKRWPPAVVVCNSHYTERTVARLYRAVPTAVVYNPVDLAPAKTEPGVRAGIRASLKTGERDVVILQASRMESWKGHRLLLASLSILDVDAPWTCWIAGDAQRADERAYVAELRTLAKTLGLESRLRFLGQRSDIPALMAAADLVCQPNEGPEPFGIAFIEALNASLPVVTSKMGGAEEIVNEGCGILTSPDPGEVARALANLLRDPSLRSRLGANGWARARMLCDPNRQLEALVNAFEKARPQTLDARDRAMLSNGASDEPVRGAVVRVLRESGARLSTVVDLGCGQGDMARRLQGLYRHYIGCDLVTYGGFPTSPDVQFVRADLNGPPYPIDAGIADVVVSTETIEHLENPRAFVRELARIARPGGHVIFTTPNQLSLLSKLTLITKHQFNAFQDGPGLYPSHITALLEPDLVRIAREAGLEDIRVHFTDRGRVPFSSAHWPAWLGLRGRAFSDNVLIAAVKPGPAARLEEAL